MRTSILSGGTAFHRYHAETSKHQQTFYEAWRLIIQRPGIHNPWTDRGAIAGLLAHGPHSVRDVLATPILKQTGSQSSHPRLVAIPAENESRTVNCFDWLCADMNLPRIRHAR